MMMSKLLLTAVLAIAGVNGYAIIEPRGCTGVSTCTSFVGGAEFAATFADDNVTITSCKFGQNSNEEGVPDDEFCTQPCDADIEHECICLSEAVSQSGKDKESYILLIASVLIAVFFVPIVIVMCVRRRSFNKAADEWIEAYEKAGKDESKVGLRPAAPHELTCWALLIIVAVMAIVFGTKVAGIRNAAFWTGCGSFDDVLNPDVEDN